MAESIEQWALFIKHARRTRLDHTQFGSFAVQLNRQNPLPSIRICDLILRPYDEVGVGAADSLDPRVPAYLAQILLLGLIDASSCLRALKNYTSWTTANETTEQQQRKRWKKSYHGDETVILALTKHIAANDEVPKSERDAINLVRAATEWAVLLTTSINEQMAPGVDGINDDQHLPSDRIALRIAYGMLVLGIAENALVVKTLRTGCPQSRCSSRLEAPIAIQRSRGTTQYCPRIRLIDVHRTDKGVFRCISLVCTDNDGFHTGRNFRKNRTLSNADTVATSASR